MSGAPRAITERVRWAWLNGPAALAFILLYLLAGLPWSFGALLMSTGSGALAAVIAFLPLLAFLALQAHSAEMQVGADGVLFRWFGTTRFYPYREIRACVASHDVDATVGSGSTAGPFRGDGEDATVLQIDLRSGKSVRVRAGGLGLRGGRFERGAEIVDRIRSGVEAAQRDTSDSKERVLELARRQRETSAWLSDLTRRARDRGYRAGAVDRDELLEIVESSVATPTARVGAAAILRKSGLQEEERNRMRIAAEASVAPRLRIALEAAADQEVEEQTFEEEAARVARAERP